LILIQVEGAQLLSSKRESEIKLKRTRKKVKRRHVEGVTR